MNQIKKFFLHLQVDLLDLHQSILDSALCRGLYTEQEWRDCFGVYLQRKSMLNSRIQKIGGRCNG